MMKFSVRKIFIVFGVFVVVLGILRGAQWVYLHSVVRSPLRQSISRIHGVSRVSINPQGEISVILTKDANLMGTYEAIETATKSVMGHAPANLAIHNHPNASMNSMVNALRLIVAQGEATGQYVAMNKAIQHLAGDHHMTATVQLSNHHIFVSLQSKSHWLDEVMPLKLGGAGS
ncbi:MAG: hypothetical protein M1493_05925 [Firmicutes bacterium]|jgi:hypothetical protein|uniref:Uncharacterized protein n=1 Tax=Sulfobacillus benefaciens TaxID=453960 RepID=A0A2T2WW36_9FIRM|nr:hypothetical protein [Bacillota bacterium]PSR26432.1 MAG: hypothetical protein C7B43_13910 [Sulfobacillus benefaciens]HBQ94329.1 hypothetical protein [Sulfobacillus sp.]